MPRFEDTMVVWRVFEQLYRAGRVRALGISNTYDLDTLQKLYEEAEVKPTILQNRFYTKSHFDVAIRKFCKKVGIAYESFWSLTANRKVIERYVRSLSKTIAH